SPACSPRRQDKRRRYPAWALREPFQPLPALPFPARQAGIVPTRWKQKKLRRLRLRSIPPSVGASVRSYFLASCYLKVYRNLKDGLLSCILCYNTRIKSKRIITELI